MGDCPFCAADRVVPVLDKRIERSPRAGNKFRSRCLGCSRWLPMTSEAAFRDHPNPHVLPVDADPDEAGNLVALSDYEYGPEWADLVAKQQRPNAADVAEAARAEAARTDGGASTVPDVVDEGDDDADVNRFTCPAEGCEADVEGHPDECPDCGAPYQWPGQDAADGENEAEHERRR